MKELKFHVGNVATFLKYGYKNGWGYNNDFVLSCGDSYNNGDGSGRAYGASDGDKGYGNNINYYKVKDRTLVGE